SRSASTCTCAPPGRCSPARRTTRRRSTPEFRSQLDSGAEESAMRPCFALLPLLVLSACHAPSARPSADNPEIARICAEDQADREPPAGQEIDWKVVGPRDAARLARIQELFQQGALHSGPDYSRAALV